MIHYAIPLNTFFVSVSLFTEEACLTDAWTCESNNRI